jgi:hypothetical protein
MPETTLIVEAHVLEEMNRILDGPGLEDTDQDGVIQTFTGQFSDGCSADIKICNGDTPWIDAVLFGPNGGEIALLEPQDGPLDGEYEWEVGERTYRLEIRPR